MSSSKDNFLANVQRRLKQLRVSANAAAVENGKGDGWLTDIMRRSNLPLDICDDIAAAIGVPVSALVEKRCPVRKWPPPKWVEGARQRAATAQKRGAVTRAQRKAVAQA